MTLTLSPRATREAERCARWWYEHRPAARLLFDEELRRVLDQIRSAPNLGGVFKARKSGREYRRVLMPETRPARALAPHSLDQRARAAPR